MMLSCCLGLLACAMDPASLQIVDFSAETLPDFTILQNTSTERIQHDGAFVCQVDFEKVDWPNIFFNAPEPGWDWSDYTGIAVALFNPGVEPVDVAMRVDNAGADGQSHCNNASGVVPPGESFVLRLQFSTNESERFWGMRGVPVRGPLGAGSKLDLAKITAFQVFLPRPQREYTLLFKEAWLFGAGASTGDAVPMPFIDRFGQYKHADWPGKLLSEEDLKVRRDAETDALNKAPALAGQDAYGGWADGPQQEATGWFRTEKVNGKWWLVTPEGRLFFSTGMDCVGTWTRTFIEGRIDWFDWLPEENDPVYQPFFSEVSNAHSMADIIGGKGKTFGFYGANLFRKFGEDWAAQWRENTYRRLHAWGFNTVGNWSQADVLANSALPYVASTGLGSVRRIEGATGYWGKMMDVYDPSFEDTVQKTVSPMAAAHAGNPKCIGFFVDNELAWEGVSTGALKSPADQPCRKVFLEQLRAQYGELSALNAAWQTSFNAWEELAPPAQQNTVSQKDFDAFLYAFARRYFSVINDAIKKAAPHHLYLGCRFSGAPEAAVRACADVADVVSFNMYYREVPADKWIGDSELSKPILIGEFHFGALDRGMFHPGLVAARDQADRAENYRRYLRSVADHPAYVGCHWFQYVDEPNTGRWFDGENYNIGFVDVTDTPYDEMVEAARQVHEELYTRRYGRAGEQNH